MKKVVYDKYYVEANHFGKPYKGLIEFFISNDRNKTVLDLGGGQGRDSIPIAKLGYSVICVDHSSVGIAGLKEESEKLNLGIECVIDDLYTYEVQEKVDIVLMDSILHFYINDIKKETALITRIMDEIKIGGLLVNCMIKGGEREKYIKYLINNHSTDFQLLLEDYVDYPEAGVKYHMIVIKKVEL